MEKSELLRANCSQKLDQAWLQRGCPQAMVTLESPCLHMGQAGVAGPCCLPKHLSPQMDLFPTKKNSAADQALGRKCSSW